MTPETLTPWVQLAAATIALVFGATVSFGGSNGDAGSRPKTSPVARPGRGRH
jgi:hypothetical protein